MRKKQVRVHMINKDLPTIEGYKERPMGREFMVRRPKLLVEAQGNPVELESQLLAIPRENIAFYEIL